MVLLPKYYQNTCRTNHIKISWPLKLPRSYFEESSEYVVLQKLKMGKETRKEAECGHK